MMKEKKLALMLRFSITDLSKVTRTVEGVPPRMDFAYDFTYDAICVPVELKAMAVISADQKTVFALWATDVSPPPSTKPAR